MEFFEWKKDYELGIKLVDEEHKQLVKLINELERAITENKTDQVIKGVLQGLKGYINIHFTVEEEYMNVYDYSGLKSHTEAHEQFKKKIFSISHDLEEGGLDIPKSVLVYLKKWLQEHILETDRKLCLFLKEQKIN
ncbi:MAG: bacteriohemerythrin [Deltaproteobacteria bacterium]|nr:bacteriohemerythrin [Deltaproteobacteria bacterium]